MFFQYLQTNPPFFFAVVITVVVSITLHELAHGITAIWLGDRTPIETGHMTLNPIVHMGGVSIIALLLAGIAWGLMPIDPTRIRGRHGDALVSIAGPLSNVILALLALTSLGLWYRFGGALDSGTPGGNLQYLLQVFGFMNIGLAMFNMLPIPPLDGSRVLSSFSNAYRQIAGHLSTSGGTMILLIVAFSASSKVIFPAAGTICLRYLKLFLVKQDI